MLNKTSAFTAASAALGLIFSSASFAAQEPVANPQHHALTCEASQSLDMRFHIDHNFRDARYILFNDCTNEIELVEGRTVLHRLPVLTAAKWGDYLPTSTEEMIAQQVEQRGNVTPAGHFPSVKVRFDPNAPDYYERKIFVVFGSDPTGRVSPAIHESLGPEHTANINDGDPTNNDVTFGCIRASTEPDENGISDFDRILSFLLPEYEEFLLQVEAEMAKPPEERQVIEIDTDISFVSLPEEIQTLMHGISVMEFDYGRR